MKISTHQKIKNIRKIRRYTQEFMANKMHISQMAYSKIERGETQLNWNKLNVIADILSINIWELIDTTRNTTEIAKENNYTNNIELLTNLTNQYEIKIKHLQEEVKKLKLEISTLQHKK
ncbi:MAG: helix-turn-helix transcriptional regulator [Flavobacteriales bacterium]|nr:helix-turn-helix transcriptional regulator [Flavobacteriales bacterium]